ncbi:MAG: hypothetical protein HFP77_08795 [Methylococcales symbiont of Iophon sp. n. MRB-2018]|nr:MAG: hypothetical protein HFP77_08795 [Methylococcales symbiont of Iophon sp. n. MRB-2018]KAF3979350.1 MAG: hypothetical protein HFP76_07885 [Methylococcales symbiont of Iophon sp. n. MRB-2018]
MNTAFLLVLLTLGDVGQINAAFVNTKSLIACQTKGKMLGVVISASGTEIVKNSCFKSDLMLSKFSHSQAEKKKARTSYLIVMEEQDIEIRESKNRMYCYQRKDGIKWQR